MSNTMKITNGYTKGESADPENGLKLVLLVAFMVMIISLIAGCPAKAQTMRTGKVIADTLRSDSALILADGTVLKGASDLGGGISGNPILADATTNDTTRWGMIPYLRRVNEDGNVGFRLKFDGNTFNGNIGRYAVDLSNCIMGGGYGATGNNSFAVGSLPNASGHSSISMGDNSEASATGAVSLGIQNRSRGSYSFATNYRNDATGMYSFAIGYSTSATNSGSFSAGYNTYASSPYSSTFGYYTETSNDYQFMIGKYNSNKYTSVFEVGIGTGDASRKNGFEVTTTGRVLAPGLVIDSINNDKSLVTKEYLESVIIDPTETDPIFTAWDKDYNDLINKPAASATPTINEVLTAGSTIAGTSTLGFENPMIAAVDLQFVFDSENIGWSLANPTMGSPLITFPFDMQTTFNTDVDFEGNATFDLGIQTNGISLNSGNIYFNGEFDVLKSYYAGTIQNGFKNGGYFREPIKAYGMRSDTCTTTSYRVPMNYALINLLAQSDSINISIADRTFASTEYGDDWNYYFGDLSYVSDVYVAADGQNTKLTFPADWKWIGETPTSLNDGQTAVINLQSKGSGDTNIVANYRVLDAANSVVIGEYTPEQDTVEIDITADNAVAALTISENTVFTIDTTAFIANVSGSRTIEILIKASDDVTLSFPNYMKWIGQKPTTLAINKEGLLTIKNYGTDVADIVMGYSLIGNGN